MKKILLIEDNELNRDMLSRRLQKRGYEVVTAVDGETGITMAQAEAPALILMDVSLPGIDGLEATRRLKAAPQTRHIPIVALTAHTMASDRDKALAVGLMTSIPRRSSYRGCWRRLRPCSVRDLECDHRPHDIESSAA